MALDRQSIEKRDFPIGRRGYEPDAVDEHLAMLADEVDALRRAASRSTRAESPATAASQQVRLIVEAAEQSSADIEREAELEARQIRQEAREAAESARSEAGEQAREHVERVSGATASMLERADTLESEFQSLLESVRGSATRLRQELQNLQDTVGKLRAQAPSAPGFEAEADPAPHGDPALDSAAAGEGVHGPRLEEDPAAPAAVAAEDGNAGDDGDEEGARLIALNMALNGTPREETERYLAENFDLADTESLLDDVYARAGQ